ncbi:uncharacterized protein LOC143464647 [Clavelina lepadiformis]|uniref:uncharacterized protein LOC143464647 n=1 Tax=Clavelina lepadiformis TaxID=159417 RepID=UPI004041507E
METIVSPSKLPKRIIERKRRKIPKNFHVTSPGYFETRQKEMRTYVQGFRSVQEGRDYGIKSKDLQQSNFGQAAIESFGEFGQELSSAYKNLSDSTAEAVAAREIVAKVMLERIDSSLERKSIEKESEQEMEEAAGQEVSERKEDEMVVDDDGLLVDGGQSDGLEGDAEENAAEEVQRKKPDSKRKANYKFSREGKDKCPLCDKYVKHLVKHLKGAKHKDDAQVKELVMSLDKRRRDNTAKSPEPKSPTFSWTACLKNFSGYLQSVYGGGKRLVDAEKQKSILQRIVSKCNFEDLQAFTLDTYQAKHVKLLEEGSCKPSTFIAHNPQ